MGGASGVRGKELSQVNHLISKAEICVPVKQGVLNEVDRLTDKIRLIKESCSHDYRFTGPVYLRESLEKGVYILYDASFPSTLRPKHVLKCQKCSEETELNITKTCPHCLGEMKEDKRKGYIYFSTFPYHCVKCGFKGVVNVWDQ